MNSEIDERPNFNRTPSTLPDICLRSNEKQPLLSGSSLSDIESSDQHLLPIWNPISDDDDAYVKVITEAERAIQNGVLPVRIAAGSSGSYFVKNMAGVSLNLCQRSSIFSSTHLYVENNWRIQTQR